MCFVHTKCHVYNFFVFFFMILITMYYIFSSVERLNSRKFLLLSIYSLVKMLLLLPHYGYYFFRIISYSYVVQVFIYIKTIVCYVMHDLHGGENGKVSISFWFIVFQAFILRDRPFINNAKRGYFLFYFSRCCFVSFSVPNCSFAAIALCFFALPLYFCIIFGCSLNVFFFGLTFLIRIFANGTMNILEAQLKNETITLDVTT